MPLATFKDLVIDAQDAATLGAFWARALNRQRKPLENQNDVVLTGATKTQTVWINEVPEPRTVKNRVHLDIHTADIATLTEAGARVVNDRDFRWTVMTDPDGQEFCAFLRQEPPQDHLHEIVVDCTDPQRVAAWWATVFGLEADRHENDGSIWFSFGPLPGTTFDGMAFVPVPEPKTTKNRVHWDVIGRTAGLVAAGARLVRPKTEDPEPGRTWDVLADPEGNEFCAFAETETETGT